MNLRSCSADIPCDNRADLCDFLIQPSLCSYLLASLNKHQSFLSCVPLAVVLQMIWFLRIDFRLWEVVGKYNSNMAELQMG